MTRIVHKRSNTHLKVPLVSDLASGELSINTYDGRLFIKKTVSSVDSIVTISNDYADLINKPTYSSNTGVTVNVNGAIITINTPQDLRTTASPTFAGITTGSVTNGLKTWLFNSNGKLQIPENGDIVDVHGTSVLGGGGGGGALYSVRYDINDQNLTDTQKQNAATNMGLSPVARSGNYNDLSNKPIISDADIFNISLIM